VCSKLPASGTPAYWRVFNNRVLDLWKRYDAIAKEKKADSFFFANSGGNVHASVNLDALGKTIAWFQADNQGRAYDDPAVWGCSLQGRVCSAVMDGKFSANVTAAYSTGIQRNTCQRHGALQPFRRRGKGILRRPPLAEGGRGVF
jgi:hypothetical protein